MLYQLHNHKNTVYTLDILNYTDSSAKHEEIEIHNICRNRMTWNYCNIKSERNKEGYSVLDVLAVEEVEVQLLSEPVKN